MKSEYSFNLYITSILLVAGILLSTLFMAGLSIGAERRNVKPSPITHRAGYVESRFYIEALRNLLTDLKDKIRAVNPWFNTSINPVEIRIPSGISEKTVLDKAARVKEELNDTIKELAGEYHYTLWEAFIKHVASSNSWLGITGLISRAEAIAESGGSLREAYKYLVIAEYRINLLKQLRSYPYKPYMTNTSLAPLWDIVEKFKGYVLFKRDALRNRVEETIGFFNREYRDKYPGYIVSVIDKIYEVYEKLYSRKLPNLRDYYEELEVVTSMITEYMIYAETLIHYKKYVTNLPVLLADKSIIQNITSDIQSTTVKLVDKAGSDYLKQYILYAYYKTLYAYTQKTLQTIRKTLILNILIDETVIKLLLKTDQEAWKTLSLYLSLNNTLPLIENFITHYPKIPWKITWSEEHGFTQGKKPIVT